MIFFSVESTIHIGLPVREGNDNPGKSIVRKRHVGYVCSRGMFAAEIT